MMFQDAYRTLEQFLAPLTVDEFLDQTLVGGFRIITGQRDAPRIDLLGPDPESVLLEALHLAPKLTFHSANPTAPPPSLLSIADAADFRDRIEQFHARNYSVRFPELRPLSAPLDHLARALEFFLHQPVTASAFWSRGGMRAPVHNDDHDLIVVQLRGDKRWFVSRKPSLLGNTWENIPGDAPDLGDYETIDLHPGDLLYLPRRTLHSVDSEAESLHLSIGFTPLTVRDGIIAALDHLSDMDQTLRMSIGGRLAFQLGGKGFEKLGPPVLGGTQRLLAACQTSGFLASALQRRSARIVGALAPLPIPDPVPNVDLDTLMVHRNTAFSHLTANPQKIDFTYPGGHVYIHLGAQESILYMVNTPRFKVRDIPGTIDDDVRLSLALKFVEVGFLEVAPG
jgi:bifunctional lysine-specific demethylase and histidyl-hydroxylase MINA